MSLEAPLIAGIVATLLVFYLAWTVTAGGMDMTPLDSFWGAAPAIAAFCAVLADGRVSAVELIVVGLAGLWGFRLAAHLSERWRASGKQEDPRYASMRRKGGPDFVLTSLTNVVGLQAVLSLLVQAPIFAAAMADDPRLNALGGFGAALALLGFLVEARADAELAAFKAEPTNKGKILQTGLWAWSRHPNYVGEIAFWAGLALIAVSLGAWWALISPFLVAFLLMKFSGAPLVERRMAKTRPEAFAEYAARTPAFLRFF